SPPWGMQVIGPNVKRALCYCNVTPAFFGLGGGVLRGRDTHVETVKIYEQHMLVQVDQTLHQRTIEEVTKVSKVGGPVDFPRAAGSQIPGQLAPHRDRRPLRLEARQSEDPWPC